MIDTRMGIRNLSRSPDIGNIKDLLSEMIKFLNNFHEAPGKMSIFVDGVEVLSFKKGDRSSGVGTVENYDLNVFTNNINRMIVTKDGKVGIGTESPVYPLEVSVTGGNATFAIQRVGGAAAKITGGSSGVQFGSQSDHQVKIVVNNSTTAMTISNTAKVGIGNESPTHLLDVGTSGAYCDGAAWVDGSSREYKENIRDLTVGEAVGVLEGLDPVKFNYKGVNKESLGFIAEDVPELVSTKDRRGMGSLGVVAVLTKVVQKQQEDILCLQKEISGFGR